jgi:hypothetical protein
MDGAYSTYEEDEMDGAYSTYEEDEMDGAYSMYEEDESCTQCFRWETRREATT